MLLVASSFGSANVYVTWAELTVEALRKRFILLLSFTIWRDSCARTQLILQIIRMLDADDNFQHDPFMSFRFNDQIER